MKYYLLICSCIFLFFSCSPNKQREALFVQADSLLNSNPDSALILLKALPDLQELSRKESAFYALLMVRATNKAGKPLLPCDSLLTLALRYYDNDKKERAVALLYKGRLEIEMNNPNNAVAYLQEGLNILEKYPEEIITRRHTLRLLGDLYFDSRHYKEAIRMYRDLYNCSATDVDKSIALTGISGYYCMTNQEDSAIAIQHKAVESALLSKDSIQIATSLLELSLSFIDFDRIDSALHYAREALTHAPHKEPKGRYYNNLANLLIKTNIDRDSIIFYINKSMETPVFMDRYTALLSLSELEAEKGNYKTANAYLGEYISNLDSIIFTEKSTEIQQLIYDYNTKKQIRREQFRGRRQMRFAITCSLLSCFLIIIFYQYRITKKKKSQLLFQQTLNKTQSKLHSLQQKMEENHHIIDSLQKEHDSLKLEKESKTKEIEEREGTIERLKQEKQELRSWLFAQSDIHKKIDALSKQKVSKRDLKVMSGTEQKKLKETIFGVYADYILEMQEQYPKLVEDDLLFLCLEDAKIELQTIALCFGYCDTHAISQRKYRIKEKMN